jgi:hypothetical protein
MAITVITETQAQNAEYFYNIILKVRDILYQNRAVLKAGTSDVGDRIYYGTATVVPQTPAIQIEGTQDSESRVTIGPEDEIEFTIHIWFFHLYLDSEANEKEIHQLGDRIKEVLRQNADIDGLAIDSMPKRTRYGVVPTRPDAGFLRAGELEFWIQKYVTGG